MFLEGFAVGFATAVFLAAGFLLVRIIVGTRKHADTLLGVVQPKDRK